jgi:hypothetical protein
MRQWEAHTETAPASVDAPPEPGQPTEEAAVNNITAPSTHPATECFACYEGVVYIGHLVEDDETGETAEVFEPVPCRRGAREEL